MTDSKNISHLPINPVRRNHREIAFSACWKELMEADLKVGLFEEHDATMLDRLLDHYPEYPGQREASVCATIVTWFGTNVGQGFLTECGFFKSDALITPDSVLSRWALENRRHRAWDSGWRTLEHLLTDRERHGKMSAGRWELDVQRCSALDYEAAEHLMLWLGSVDGQAFMHRVTCMTHSVHIEGLIAAFDRGGLDAALAVLKPFDPEHRSIA